MSDNYPLGAAEDSRAPWNQEDPCMEEIQVICSNTLSKDFIIDAELDENGWVKDDFDLLKSFKDEQYSAKECLELAVKYSEEAFKLVKLLQKKYPNIAKKLSDRANNLASACMYWNEDEIEVVQD